MTPTRLILVRHGEPREDMHGRCYGRLDPPLSAAGREQMLTTARRLAPLGDAAVYSSPLRRAVESAALIAGASITAAVDERLRELDFGAVEGMTYREIEKQHPDLFREWMRNPTEVTFPGGEACEAMAARVRQVLGDLLRDRAGQTAVVVSHGGVNRIALADALGLPLASMFRLGQDYACINVVDYFGDHSLVRAMNVRPGTLC